MGGGTGLQPPAGEAHLQPVVFSPEWFAKHQTWMLRLLAWPLVGRVLRPVLAIRAHDVGWAKPIVQLLPHAYTVDNGDGTFTTDFRTHPKFAKRLFYVLWPLWAALHAWDSWVANPWMPELNLGFDTLTVYPDPGATGTTSCNGQVSVIQNLAWTTLTATAGNSVTMGFGNDAVTRFDATTTPNQWGTLRRSFFLFDTSALGGTVSISSAAMSLYAIFGYADPSSNNPSMDVYGATTASNVTLANADFAQVGSVSYTGSPMTYVAFNTVDGYKAFTLNATGVAAISTTGASKFSVRCNYDVNNVAPTWASGAVTNAQCYYSDQTGSSNDPKLEITFTPSGGWPFRHLNAGNGVSIANQGAY